MFTLFLQALFSYLVIYMHKAILEFSMVISRHVGAWSLYVLEVSTY